MQEPAAMEITAIRRLAGTALTWVGYGCSARSDICRDAEQG